MQSQLKKIKPKNKKIYECLAYFKELLARKPLAKLFSTENYGYLYDTGTSKIIQCNITEFYILERLLLSINNDYEKDILELASVFGEGKLAEILQNIKNVIEQEHLLQSIKPEGFFSPNHFEYLEENLNHKLMQIALELTERCNLRCGYCIYNPSYKETRSHGTEDMTEETAIAAIDYAYKHSDPEAGVSITFYGGEPLLKFPLLKRCVEYSQEIINDRPLNFSITTNMTLITPEIAEYLASIENMSIACSLDGPKHIHDSYRVDIKGRGSFDRAIRGLEYIADAYGDKVKDKVLINVVFAPPYSYSKMKEIDDFLHGLPWISKLAGVNVSYPVQGDITAEDENMKYLKKPYLNMNSEILDLYKGRTLGSWSQNRFFDSFSRNEDINFFSMKVVQDPLSKIHQRGIYEKPNNLYNFNACCIPGNRKIYITVKGDFLICEKAPGSPIIGNIKDGLNISKIKSMLVEEYEKASIEYCSDCWAIRLCSVCYGFCYKKGNLDMVKKQEHCEMTRNSLVEDLKFYHRCVEANPEGLAYLNNIIQL